MAKHRNPNPDPLPLSLPAGTKTVHGYRAETVPVLRKNKYWAKWTVGDQLVWHVSPNAILWKSTR